MKIISWHPVLTDHQSYTLSALQKAGQCDLNVVVTKIEHLERQAQGWINLHAAELKPILIPQHARLKHIVQYLRLHRKAIHLFSSPFEQPILIIALFMALLMGLKVFLISEPYSPIPAGYQNDKGKYIGWLKAKLRPIIYHIYGFFLSRRISGIFAISNLAIKQYRNMKISNEKIFPFGYFVPYSIHEPVLAKEEIKSNKPNLNVIFIGSLISRKGLDILIAAVTNLQKNGAAITLDVYGPGDSSVFGFNQVGVNYCGLIPFGNSQKVIKNYDLFVLPSRYDGWGVVVNESLMAGVPVICSTEVGAGSIIKKWQCGTIFESENVPDLEKKLNEFIENKKKLKIMSTAACSAAASLDPEVAGQYMFDVINHNSKLLKKISCPWYEIQNF